MQQSNSPVAADEIDIGGIIKKFRIKWHYFLIAFILFFTAAVVYIKYALPVYQANATVLLKEVEKSPSKDIEDILSGDLLSSERNLSTEMGIIKSRRVMEEAIKALSLQVSYFNNTEFPARPVYKSSPFTVEVISLNDAFYDQNFEVKIIDKNSFQLTVVYDGEENITFSHSAFHAFNREIMTEYFTMKLVAGDSFIFNPEVNKYSFVVNSLNSLVNEYLSNFTVAPLDKDATILILTVRDQVPARATELLNTICKVYIDLDIKDKANVASLTLKFVDEQLQNTKSTLGNIETQMQSFKEQNATVDLSEEAKSVLNRLNQLDIDRVKSDIELKSLNNLLDYITTNEDLTNFAPTSLGIPDPLLIELLTNYQNLQAKRKSLAYGVKSTTPALKIVDEQIIETKTNLIENINSIRDKMLVSNRSLRDQIAQYESNIKQVPELERQLIGIKRNFDVTQNIYTYLLQKQAETSIAKATAVSDNKVLDEATLSDEPVAPNKKLILTLAALLALFFPAMFVFSQDFFRTTILGREELSKLTGIPIIGIIGHLAKADNLIVHHKPKSVLAEGFRSIRTNLKFFGIGGNNKIICITSSVSREGKSFTSINLASILALQNNKVVVIGLDLRKPRLYQDFNLKNNIGVSSYLIGNASIDQVIQKTGIDNLDLVSSGPLPPNPAELIAKPELAKFFEELTVRYDYVVIDTPPLGIVADALMIMNHSQLNVYIVRERYTKKEYLVGINDLFQQGKIKNLALILNDSNLLGPYGYGYGYGGYYSQNGHGYYEDTPEKSSGKKLFRKKEKETT